MYHEAINKYNPLTLEQLNASGLISDREDRKYIIPVHMIDEVIALCNMHYNVLEIGGDRVFDYRTTYYDTKELSMYHLHQRGKKNRCKVRKREYLNTNETFFEVKINNNKDKTSKQRLKTDRYDEAKVLINQYSPYETSSLLPAITIEYKRITLMHKCQQEKVTLDIGMKCIADSKQVSFEQLVFAEVKTKTPHDIECCRIMKQMGIRGGSLSKYCLGIISLYPEVKHNNFKVPLTKIKKTAAHAIS